MFVRRFAGLVLAVLFLAGMASPAAGADTADVQGKVTFAGKPVVKGKVVFQPAKGKAVVANLNKDGSFSAKAVPVGPTKVAITAPGLPKKYTKVETSGLTFEVRKGEQQFDIQLQ